MKVQLAEKHGFCFGVQRAIDIAEQHPNAKTIGPLIHNPREINRLKENFSIEVVKDAEQVGTIDAEALIIRTHGITKESLQNLQGKNKKIIDATCPFVTKPQEICAKMSEENYQVVIFGDAEHPEVKGVKSYGEGVIIVKNADELKEHKLKRRVAIISQTTKNIDDFQKVVDALIKVSTEVRVFNTICNATLENQEAAYELSKKADIMIIIGGKNSSNTKQLWQICKTHCQESYLIESKEEVQPSWFQGKQLCGITAGASTPKWIIDETKNIIEKI